MPGSCGASWPSFVHHRAARGLRLLWSVSLPDAVAREFHLLPAPGAPPMPPALLRERLARERLCPAAAAITALTPDGDVLPGYGFTSVAAAAVRADPLPPRSASRSPRTRPPAACKAGLASGPPPPRTAALARAAQAQGRPRRRRRCARLGRGPAWQPGPPAPLSPAAGQPYSRGRSRPR